MAGRAAGIYHQSIGMRGFGEIVDLSVAMSNDFAVGETVSAASAAMTTPKLKMLEAGQHQTKPGDAMKISAVRLLKAVVLYDARDHAERCGGKCLTRSACGGFADSVTIFRHTAGER